MVGECEESSKDETLTCTLPVDADRPVLLPHRRPAHQHLLWTPPLWERHPPCHLCVSASQNLKLHSFVTSLWKDSRRLLGFFPDHCVPLLLLHLCVPGANNNFRWYYITFNRSPLRLNPWKLHCKSVHVKAGLIGLLVAQFRLPILVAIAYLCLSIAYHVSSLNTRW